MNSDSGQTWDHVDAAWLKPDYRGGSIVNLMSSVCASFGAPSTGYAPLRALTERHLATARHVVLLVIDGVGFHYLARRDRSLLKDCLQAPMTSVFPPTTAAAIPAFLTGFPPQQHGFTGWFTFIEEIDRIAAILPFTERGGNAASLTESGVTPRGLSGTSLVFERITAPCHVIMPAHIAYSEFNTAFSAGARITPYQTLGQMFSTIEEIVNTADTRSYVYAYWPQFDSLAHEYGVTSGEVADHFRSVDTGFGRLLETLEPPTTVIVTADHGFVDSGADCTVEVASHPGFVRALARPLSGEPRAAYCHVKPEERDGFESYLAEQLERQICCFPSDVLLESEYFGLGRRHPRLRSRIGDYVLAMRANYMIKDWVCGEHRYQHIGVHGGLSGDEMLVPLVVAQT